MLFPCCGNEGEKGHVVHFQVWPDCWSRVDPFDLTELWPVKFQGSLDVRCPVSEREGGANIQFKNYWLFISLCIQLHNKTIQAAERERCCSAAVTTRTMTERSVCQEAEQYNLQLIEAFVSSPALLAAALYSLQLCPHYFLSCLLFATSHMWTLPGWLAQWVRESSDFTASEDDTVSTAPSQWQYVNVFLSF